MTVLSPALLRQKRSQKRGIRLTVMLCGESGSGKSSFVNTLCKTNVIAPLDMLNNIPRPESVHLDQGLRLDSMTVEIPDQGDGVLTLNIIDPVGFGQNLDSEPVFSEISNYLDRQFDFVLAEESRIRRNPRFTDSRVHAIVYFITATGHGLREPDVVFMKHIATKANVIPVLAKADGLTPEEVELNKKLIMEDIKKYEIPVYGFPGGDGFQYADGDDAGSVKGKGSMHSRSNYGDSASEEEEEDSGSDSGSIVDEEFLEFSKVAKAKVPFAVIGASDIDSNHGQLVRRYPWGTVDIDDPAVSDMAIVREVVTKTHVNDLRDTTEYVLYENYRTYKLSVDLQEEEEEKDKTVESNIVTANTSVASLQPPPSMSRGATSKGTADTSLMDEDSTSETQSTHKDHAFGLGGGSSSSNVHLPLSPGGLGRQSSLSGSELAPAALLREEKMRASEARLKETESKLAQDLQQRRAELVAQEAQLRLLEEQLRSQAAALREDKERVSALEARP